MVVGALLGMADGALLGTVVGALPGTSIGPLLGTFCELEEGDGKGLDVFAAGSIELDGGYAAAGDDVAAMDMKGAAMA